jgi:hypothetical protein
MRPTTPRQGKQSLPASCAAGCEGASRGSDGVVFSIRHVEVKLFLAIDPLVINAFRSIALLSGIGSVGPPMMDQKDGAEQSNRRAERNALAGEPVGF